MRKVLLALIFGGLACTCAYSQTVMRFGSDFTGSPASYTFTSTDMVYRDAVGGTFSTSGSNLCGGALRRTQVSTLILRLVSTSAASISIPGQSSGSSLRTLTTLETATSLNGTYTTVPAASYSTTSTINSSSTCGVLDITNLNLTAGTFVRFTFSGNVNVSGFDVTPAATGTPSTQASNISFSNVSQTGMTLSWTRGNGTNVAVFVKDGAGAITNPTNGSTYTANAVFGTGTQLGSSGYYCVYSGSGTTVDISGLTASHTYYIQAFEFNGAGATTNYLTTTATNNPNNQATLAPGSDYRSVASGNWNSIATWEVYNGSAWVAASATPSNSDGAISIQNGHVVTVTANVTVDELTVNAGGEVDVNSGVTLTVANGTSTDIILNGVVKNTGTFTLGASATMSVGATGTYQDAQPATTGTITIPTATWSAGSTFKLTGLVGTVSGNPVDYNSLQGTNQTFSNFTIDVPNLVGKLVLTRNAAASLVVSGALTINSTGTSIYGVQISSSGNQETLSVGSYVQNGGVVSIIHNSSNGTAKALNVTGGFSLTGTAVFNISAYTTGTGVSTLAVGGNITVAPTALVQRNTSLGVGGTTNMTFNGTSSQSVTMYTAGTINYAVNNAAGLSLGNDLTANGTLNFTAGNITTGANKVAVSSTGSIVNGGTGGWVAGNLRRNIATGATVSTFQIGDATGYRPVLLSFGNVGTTGDVTASVSQTAGDHASIGSSGLDAGKTVNRFWTLANTGVVFDQYDATFTFLAGDVDGGANTSAFIVKKYDGAWSSPTTGTRTTTSTQATGLTAFSDFVIGEAASAGAPTVSTQPNNSSVCAGGNSSFTSASTSVPAPTVVWERSTDGSSWVTVTGVLDGGVYSGFNSGTLTITGATASINNYQYRAVFSNVNGSVNSNAATLTVNPVPAVTTANTASLCSGTATNISLTASTPSTFAWTVGTITGGISGASAGSGTTIAQTLTNPGNSTAGSVQYIVTPTSTATPACAGSAYIITVSVNPTPVVTTASTAAICSATGPNITLTSSAPSTYSWTIGTNPGGITGASAGSGSTINQTLTNPGNSTAAAIEYLVTATTTGGACPSSAPYSIMVTVNPLPGITTPNTKSICTGTATNIALTPSAPSTFAWTIGTITGSITGASAGSGSTINQTLTNPSNSTAGSVQYIVTPTSVTGSCVGAPYTITVTVNPIPVVAGVPSTASICHNSAVNIPLNATAPSTFAWTVGTITGSISGASAGSGNTIAQTLTNPSNAVAGTVEYLVTPTSTGGSCQANAAYTITVTVNPAPVITSPSNAKTICTGASTNVSLTTSAPSTISWTIGTITGGITGASAGSGSTINQVLTNPSITTAGTVEYLITPTSTGGGCPSAAPYVITVTVSPTSNAGSLNGNQTICIGGTPANITASGITGSVVRWESSADAAFTTPAVIANTTTTLSPGALTASRYFRLVTQSGACGEAVSVSPVLITVNTAIQPATVPAGTSGGAQLCSTHDVVASVNYFDNCNMIATVTPSGALPVSGSVTACVKVESGVITAPVTNEPYVARHFNIAPASNPLTATSTITLYFLQSEFNAFNTANGSYPDLPTAGGDATGIANLRVSQFPGSSTTPGTAGGVQINPADVDIQFADGEWKVSFATTGSGSFFVHTGTFVLPVTLSYFKGEQSGVSNNLTWSTATEQNNKGFEVERSADGRNFSRIGFVASKAESGTSSTALNYSFTDNNPFPGNSYYRLRQSDNDGRATISKTIVVSRKVTGIRLGSLYPNPATSELSIIITAPGNEKINLVVTDLSGKLVIQQQVELAAGDNTRKLAIGKLSAGTYLIKVICENGCETSIQRFIKQ